MRRKQCLLNLLVCQNFESRSVGLTKAGAGQKEEEWCDGGAKHTLTSEGKLILHLIIGIMEVLIIVFVLLRQLLSSLGEVDGLAPRAAAALDDVAGVDLLHVVLVFDFCYATR